MNTQNKQFAIPSKDLPPQQSPQSFANLSKFSHSFETSSTIQISSPNKIRIFSDNHGSIGDYLTPKQRDSLFQNQNYRFSIQKSGSLTLNLLQNNRNSAVEDKIDINQSLKGQVFQNDIKESKQDKNLNQVLNNNILDNNNIQVNNRILLNQKVLLVKNNESHQILLDDLAISKSAFDKSIYPTLQLFSRGSKHSFFISNLFGVFILAYIILTEVYHIGNEGFNAENKSNYIYSFFADILLWNSSILINLKSIYSFHICPLHFSFFIIILSLIPQTIGYIGILSRCCNNNQYLLIPVIAVILLIETFQKIWNDMIKNRLVKAVVGKHHSKFKGSSKILLQKYIESIKYKEKADSQNQ